MKTLLVAGLLVLTVLAVLPAADARPLPEPQCMEIYREYNVGPVTYISRNSCDPGTVYLCGKSLGELDLSCV